jgi:hypothetical protein
MIKCDLVIANYLKKYKIPYQSLYGVLPEILSDYWQYVSEWHIDAHATIRIGVTFPQCVPHINLYKNVFLELLKKKGYTIRDIIFYFHNKNEAKNNHIKNNTAQDSAYKKKLISTEEEKAVKKKIADLCSNQTYHDLLYQLYLMTKRNER